jgi:hypothetical protein
MQDYDDVFVRVSIDPHTSPVLWEIWTRYDKKSPWAFLTDGYAPTVRDARNIASTKASAWVSRVTHSHVKLHVVDTKKEIPDVV